MFAEGVAAILAGGLLLIVGVGVLLGRSIPGELWGLAGTALGWWSRDAVARRRSRRSGGG